MLYLKTTVPSNLYPTHQIKVIGSSLIKPVGTEMDNTWKMRLQHFNQP